MNIKIMLTKLRPGPVALRRSRISRLLFITSHRP